MKEKPDIESKRRQVESQIGKPIVIRGIRTDDPHLRGRVTPKSGYLLLEYQVSIPGFFWHFETIEQLLDRIAAGEQEIELRET